MISSCSPATPNNYTTSSQVTTGDYSQNIATNSDSVSVNNYPRDERIEEMTLSRYIIKLCKESQRSSKENYEFKELHDFLLVEDREYQKMMVEACAQLSIIARDRFSKEDALLLMRILEIGKNKERKGLAASPDEENPEDIYSVLEVFDDFASRREGKGMEELAKAFGEKLTSIVSRLDDVLRQCFTQSVLYPLLDRIPPLIKVGAIFTYEGRIREVQEINFTDIDVRGFKLSVDLDNGSFVELSQIFGFRPLYIHRGRVVLTCYYYNQARRCLVLPYIQEIQHEDEY